MRDARRLLVGALLAALTLALGPRAAVAQDAVKVAGKNFKVLLENDRVRVLDFHAKPGDKVAMHSHPDYVVYSVSASKSRFTSADGKTTDRSSKAGQATWRGAETHAAENIGSDEIHAVLVELKGPPKKVAAKKK